MNAMFSCFRLRGVDPDGDRLIFGALGPEAALVTVENTGNNEAEVYLARQLDHETGTEHQILLSLTDGHLGQDNYITHSLLILVEDTNDNIPVFTELPPSVVIQEHQHPGVIAQFRATDRDSGAFGQVGLHSFEEEIFREVYC
jgi:cadherin 23